MNPLLVFFITFGEAILTLLMVRLVFRGIVKAFRWATGRGRAKGGVAVTALPVVVLDKH